MIVIRLMGGLGNQMFQYAFGRSLSLKYNRELVLDQSLLLDKSSEHEVNTHRNFDLDIFKNLKFRWATPDEVFLFNGNPKANPFKKIYRRLNNFIKSKTLVIQENNKIKENYFVNKNNSCYVGRWQSYHFFKEHSAEITDDFKIEMPDVKVLNLLTDQISNSESICLHVRRGDLVTSSLYSKTIGALELDYYSKAIELMNKRIAEPTYFIFSEDIEWCKNNIITGKPTVFIDPSLSGKKAEGHFYLMRNCKHFIISNSTFAWWAAFLSHNKTKLVVYPKNWYRDVSLTNPDMCPPSWTAL